MRWQVSHKGNEEIPEIVERTVILDSVEIVEEHPCQKCTLEKKTGLRSWKDREDGK